METKEQFRKLYQRLEGIKKTAKNLYELQVQFAFWYRDQLKDIIANQKFIGPPLSYRWIREKERHGGDPRILVDTKEYLDAIRVFKLGKSVYAGVDPRAKHKGSGLRMIQLAAILEFGTRTIPPRPHHLIARLRVLEYMKRRYRKIMKWQP